MAEDLTTFTLAGAHSGQLSATATTLTAATDSDPRGRDYFAYKDYGADYFGNHVIEFAFRQTAQGTAFSSVMGVLGLGNAADNLAGAVDEDRLQFNNGASGIAAYYDVDHDTTADATTGSYTIGTWYYARMWRRGTTLAVDIYTDAGRTTLKESLSVESSALVKQQYLLLAQSRDDISHNPNRTVGFEVKDVTILYADAPPASVSRTLRYVITGSVTRTGVTKGLAYTVSEDLGGYTLGGADSGELSVSGGVLTVSSAADSRSEEFYAYKDFGAGYFAAGYEIRYAFQQVDVGTAGFAALGVVGLATNASSIPGATDEDRAGFSNDGSLVTTYNAQGHGGSDVTGQSYSLATWYYATLKRTGTTLSLDIHTDPERTSLKESLSCTLSDVVAQRYLLLLQSNDTTSFNANRTAGFKVKDLVIVARGDVATQSLGYAVLTTPSAPTKGLQYALTGVPTPTDVQKTVGYAVAVPQAPKTKSLAYAIPNPLISKALGYQLVGQQLTWMDRGGDAGYGGDLSVWTVDDSNGTVAYSDIKGYGHPSLVLTSTSGNVSAKRPLVTPTEPYLVEFDLYADSGEVGRLELLDGADNPVAWVEVTGATLTATFETDSVGSTSFPWDPAWNAGVFEVDPDGGTVTCWGMTYTGTPGLNGAEWTFVATKAFGGATVAAARLRTISGSGSFAGDELRVFLPDLFAVGDSITSGSSPGTYAYYWNCQPQHRASREEETFPHSDKIGRRFTTRRWVANRGVAGNKTSDLAARFQQDVLDQGAGMMTLIIGTNDIIASVSASTIETNIQGILDDAAAAGVRVLLGTIPPSVNFSGAQNTIKNAVNTWIRARSGIYVRLVEIHDLLEDPATPDQLLALYDSGDGTHPSDEGQQVIADAFFAVLSAGTKPLGYAVATTPAAATTQLGYAAATTTAAQLKVRYTAGEVSRIGVQKAAGYAVATTPAAPTKEAGYAARTTPAAKTAAAQYAVRTQTALTKSLSYAVAATPGANAESLGYAVRTQTAPTKEAGYAARTTPAITLGAGYQVTGRNGVLAQRAVAYSVRGTAGVGRTARYVLAGETTPVGVQKTAAYLVSYTGRPHVSVRVGPESHGAAILSETHTVTVTP